MAKEKPATKPEVANANDESIDEALRQENLSTKEIAQKAVEKNKAENEERIMNELRREINRAEYCNWRDVAQTRKTKQEMRAQEDTRNEGKKLLEQLKGGEITMVEYRDARKELEKKQREKFSKISEELSKTMRELRQRFPGYYCYEWDCGY